MRTLNGGICVLLTHLFIFCLFVAFTEIHKLWQLVSRKRGCQEGTKFGSLIEGALLYLTTGIGEFWSREPWGPKK